MKVRIIKRTVFNNTSYIIQKRFLFWWYDGCYSVGGNFAKSSHPTLAFAKANLCYFDGSKPKEEVVYV